ncbi:uncharacterized protein F5891DRAFT_1195803 [Suillus fuscotomentosus]|uniref:BTB domain-containing protein n=1 Tax=Suillus fuscotomentosus TaxID=1912939 RepID=A0AAD4DTX7_9AGAM|nr:uncharacterized protein F5891DRAFT_1195803 [Suillus fuscotomentosus]KAG1893888.1 hypothetical protein F5891DRAFT_1195803 [Suillus fuscotomentosus]
MNANHRLALQRHSEFWFEDGNIVFRAGNTSFCVHRGVLVRHSPALEGILAIPSGYDTDGTEQLPIVLQQISEQEFTHFLNWVYHISSVPPPPEEQFLVAILKISHLWMISNSIKFAIDGLENLTLHPTRRLELARLYSIPQWIAPAIREIMTSSLTNTTDNEATQMGFKVYTIIARAKEVMERERRALAAYPPSLLVSASFSCSARSHSQCKEAWSGFWWKKVARAILHPKNPLPLTQTLQLILEAPLPNGMNAACRQAMVDAMIELDGLEVEERIIEGVIRAVTLYFSSL